MHQVLYDRRLFSVPYTITNCVALRRLVIGSAITKLYGCVAATRQCEDDSRVDDGRVCCLPILKVSAKSARLGNWIFGYFWNWRVECCDFTQVQTHQRWHSGETLVAI